MREGTDRSAMGPSALKKQVIMASHALTGCSKPKPKRG
jgi:hypothetical protein